jgi:large subunit ribosomal protein L15
MTFLSTLTSIKERKRKRVGRGYGSGVGAKSRRGTTRHQSAREKIKIEYEGGQNKMTKKFPLLRGKGRNKSIQTKVIVISIEELNKLPAKSEVTLKSLSDAKITNGNPSAVKIVAGGKLKHSLTVKLPTSKTAKLEIEKSGGSVKSS